MSRGLGRVQREILALIAQAKPSGGWQIEELCQRIYGGPEPTRAQKNAVVRALKRMPLPGSWRTARVWRRGQWLYDRNALAADQWHRVPIAEIELGELELVEISVLDEDE
jgi:hypothetical protein